MLLKICSLCLEIHAMKEGSKAINTIAKLPESNNPYKNSRHKDYKNVKDASHCIHYVDNKYAPQIRPTEGTPDTCQHYEEHPSHTLSVLTRDLLNPSHNSSLTPKRSQSDSDESICSLRGGIFDSSLPDTRSSLSEYIGTVCPSAEWKEELGALGAKGYLPSGHMLSSL
jgi:hypothetical protein